MGNHIFLASQENFKKCLEYGVYGGISHTFERTNSEIIAGFEAIRPGDFFFFYEDWLVRKLADGGNGIIQSMLVAFDFQDKMLEYMQTRRV